MFCFNSVANEHSTTRLGLQETLFFQSCVYFWSGVGGNFSSAAKHAEEYYNKHPCTHQPE